MIVFVDLEHDRLRSDPTLWRFFSGRALETRRRIEALSGQPCTTLRYGDVNPAVLEGLNPAAVVVGGNYTGFQHFSQSNLAGLSQVLRQPTCSLLAICGAFQLLARIHGGELGPMGRAGAGQGEASGDTDTPYPPELLPLEPERMPLGNSLERGFTHVRVIRPNPLFDGLAAEVLVYQLHGGEVKGMPPGFSRLAESDRCRVQAIAHERLPLFGVQFHPERYDADHPDGRRILENFFRLAEEP